MVHKIVEEVADISKESYKKKLRYLDKLSDDEKKICEIAFDNAINVGVSTYKFGDRLIDEVIYNHVLGKVKLKTTLLPITAYACLDGNDFVVTISPYSMYYILKDSFPDHQYNEIELTGYYRAILKHELLHITLMHLVEDKNHTNHAVANIVTDALINNMIVEFKNLNIPMITPEEALKGANKNGMFYIASETAISRNFTWEQYYDYLMENFKDEIPVETAKYVVQSSGGRSSGSMTDGDITYVPIGELSEEVLKKIRDFFNEFMERTRGSERFNNVEKLAFNTKKKINNTWRSVLKKIFSTNSLLEKRYSMKRFDKRTDLPPGKKYTYSGGLVYVFIDTSGSINTQILSDFASELYGVMKKYRYKYRVFNFSSGLTSEVNIGKLRTGKYEAVGRGGTNLSEALIDVRKKFPAPDIYIVFTDLYDDIPKPEQFDNRLVIYALTKNYDMSQKFTLIENGYTYFVVNE